MVKWTSELTVCVKGNETLGSKSNWTYPVKPYIASLLAAHNTGYLNASKDTTEDQLKTNFSKKRLKSCPNSKSERRPKVVKLGR